MQSCCSTFTSHYFKEAMNPECFGIHEWTKPLLQYCLLCSCKTRKQHSLPQSPQVDNNWTFPKFVEKSTLYRVTDMHCHIILSIQVYFMMADSSNGVIKNKMHSVLQIIYFRFNISDFYFCLKMHYFCIQIVMLQCQNVMSFQPFFAYNVQRRLLSLSLPLM